jgi:NADH-quinone oxidoreductase subunit E
MKFSPETEAKLEKLVSSYPEGRVRSALVPMLMFVQDETGAITQEIMEEVARRLNLQTIQVEEVLTYYSMLHRKPMGKHHVQVCTNVSCLLTGGMELYEQAKNRLGIGHKQVTPDGQFSLEEVECIGACSWAPAIQVNYDFHHRLSPEKFDEILNSLRNTQ